MIFCKEERAHKSARRCYRNLGFEVLTAVGMKNYIPELFNATTMLQEQHVSRAKCMLEM
jgi:hypothetical protein